MRRVRRLGPPGQTELGPAWRYHAVFTDSPFGMLVAEADHRHHAIIEQLNAELIDGPLASRYHGTARSGTLRRQLIAVPARIAHRGRDQIILHLPEHWPWPDAWDGLFQATHRADHRAPPAHAA